MAARRILVPYASPNPARVVISELDETDSLMPLLGFVDEGRLPGSDLAAGRRVPEDLWRASSDGLAAVLLREPALEERACH